MHILGEIFSFIFPGYFLNCETSLEYPRRYLCHNCQCRLKDFEPIFYENFLKRMHSIHFDTLFIRFQFDALFRRLLHYFKYQGYKEIGRYLAVSLAERMPRHTYDFILPVPLHPKKLKKRGFNQSAVVAQKLAKISHCPFSEKHLIRCKDTVSQTTLDRQERQLNVADAFDVTVECQGKTFLIVDDVITTGATLNSCSSVLKKNGAACVDIAALATPVDILQENLEQTLSPV